jgi:hypothetical protein
MARLVGLREAAQLPHSLGTIYHLML